MSQYDFDRIVDRRHTGCFKWDSLIARYGENDIIPMGVADMDFLTYPGITEALQRRAAQGVFGYSWDERGELAPVIVRHYRAKGYRVGEDDVVLATGVVYALDLAVKTFTAPGDKILLLSPYYPPHLAVITTNHRTPVLSPMVPRHQHFEIDWDDLAAKADGAKMFILCHPHNPTGRMFSQEELTRLSEFCRQRGILVVSDEIHSDFAISRPFIPASAASDYFYEQGITITSLTKTTSTSGLKLAYCFIHNADLRRRFTEAVGCSGLSSVNCLVIPAAEEFLEHGGEWEREVVEYLRENSRTALEFLHTNLPRITVYPNEGTYLLWLDMSSYDLPREKMADVLTQQARVQLNVGSDYGAPDFLRMNTACPRSLLKQALQRLYDYLKDK